MSAAVGTVGALTDGMMRCALQTRVPRGAQVKNLLSKVKLGKEKEVKEIIGRNPAILKDAFDVQGNSVLHLAAVYGCPPPPSPRCPCDLLSARLYTSDARWEVRLRLRPRTAHICINT